MSLHEIEYYRKSLYLCLRYESPEIIIEEKVRQSALKPIQRMLNISEKAGIK